MTEKVHNITDAPKPKKFNLTQKQKMIAGGAAAVTAVGLYVFVIKPKFQVALPVEEVAEAVAAKS